MAEGTPPFFAKNGNMVRNLKETLKRIERFQKEFFQKDLLN